MTFVSHKRKGVSLYTKIWISLKYKYNLKNLSYQVQNRFRIISNNLKLRTTVTYILNFLITWLVYSYILFALFGVRDYVLRGSGLAVLSAVVFHYLKMFNKLPVHKD